MTELREKSVPAGKAKVLAAPEEVGLRKGGGGYVVAELDCDMAMRAGERGDLVLCASSGIIGSEIAVNAERFHVLPRDIDPKAGLYALPVALTLWAWGSLHLELGEVAACTGAHWLDRLLPQVAIWRGARSVATVGDSFVLEAKGIVHIDGVDDPSTVVKQLSALLAAAPGAAVVELSGRAEIADIVFESLPRWSRLMLAGESSELLTVDYYNNVHRKGVVISSALLAPHLMFSSPAALGPANYLRQALAMLDHEELGPICRRLLSNQ